MSRDESRTDNTAVSRRKFTRAAAIGGMSVGLAGCSGQSQDGDTTETNNGGTTTSSAGGGEDVTLVFNTSVSGEAWDAYLEALRNSGLPDRISFELTSLPEENRGQQWERWLTAGREEPDLFMIKSTSGLPFMHRGQLQDINDLISDETRQIIDEQYSDTLVNLFQMEDGLYGVPFLFDFAVLQYRKDLVEQAGFNPSDWQTNPLSWEEFATTISQTTEQTDVENGYGWTGAERSRDQPFYDILKSYGGAYWGDNAPDENLGDRQFTLNEEEGVNALRTQLAMIYGEEYEHSLEGIPKIAPESVLQWLDTPVVQNMSGGSLASIWNYTWSITDLGAEDALGEDLGVMPIPYGVPEGEGRYQPGGGSRTFAAAWHIAINPNSQNKEAAAQVLDAMAQPDAQMTLFEAQGYAPPRTDLYEHDRVQNMDIIGRYSDALSYAVNHIGGAPSQNPLWSGERQRLSQQLGAAYRQEMDPQTALDRAVEEMQRYEEQNAGEFSG